MTHRLAERIKHSILEEDKVIGNLKNQFNRTSVHRQRQVQISPALVTGNIALSYHRGLSVGAVERTKAIVSILKKKYPMAAEFINQYYKKN